MLNIDEVKRAAAGRWKDLIISTTGFCESFFNTKSGPCPVHAGTTKFRVLRDFDETGGAVCNDCGTMSDGIATIQKLTGKPFAEALSLVAKELGIETQQPKKIEPKDLLTIIETPDVTLKMAIAAWCLHKPPIKPEAVLACRPKLGRLKWYGQTFPVLCLPVWGPKFEEADPVGWVMYDQAGGKLPSGKRGEVEYVKVKTSYKCQHGVIGDPDAIRSCETLIKLEGPPDMLTGMSMGLPGGCFTTPFGTEESPLPWMAGLATGKDVIVCHDADEAGQRGLVKWANALAAEAKSCLAVRLPFPVEPKHGKDFRDWAIEGGTPDSFALLERQAIECGKAPEPEVYEHDDDPHRLARSNLERYAGLRGGKLVYWSNEWWRYKEGRYQRISDAELRAKVTDSVREEFRKCYEREKDRYEKWLKSDTYELHKDKGPPKIAKVTNNLISNVIQAMQSICILSSSVSMPCWIPTREKRNYLSLRNGIIDLDALFAGGELEDCLLPHSPEWFSACRLDYDFDPDAQCPKWLKYLEYTLEGDMERIACLQEWAGYLLTSENDLQRFLVLEGEGQNGKTVFFAAIQAMLGEMNCSFVSIEQFDQRFALGSTIGKVCNISGDAGEIDSVAEGVLKQFTGGDSMQFDRKNKEPLFCRPTAKLMCAWNTRPRIKDKSQGLWRRMILVPFTRKVEKHVRVRGMDNPQWWIDSGECCGILKWALLGLNRLKVQEEFTIPTVTTEAIEEYREDSNPAAEFIENYISFTGDDNHWLDSHMVYKHYERWCRETGHKALANNSFGREMKRCVPGSIKSRMRDGKNLVWRWKKIIFSTDEILGERLEF